MLGTRTYMLLQAASSRLLLLRMAREWGQSGVETLSGKPNSSNQRFQEAEGMTCEVPKPSQLMLIPESSQTDGTKVPSNTLAKLFLTLHCKLKENWLWETRSPCRGALWVKMTKEGWQTSFMSYYRCTSCSMETHVWVFYSPHLQSFKFTFNTAFNYCNEALDMYWRKGKWDQVIWTEGQRTNNDVG